MFARGQRDDQARPNAWQAMVIADVTGPDGDSPEATDDELVGLLRGWTSLDSWVYAGKLKVLRALLRRRPNPGRCVGYTESGLPQVWDARLAKEIALQLGISSVAADRLILVAWSLDARLPRIGQALEDGLLDPGRVIMDPHGPDRRLRRPPILFGRPRPERPAAPPHPGQGREVRIPDLRSARQGIRLRARTPIRKRRPDVRV
jgi:hypothetical protein